MSAALDAATSAVVETRGLLTSWLKQRVAALEGIRDLAGQSGEKYLDDPAAAASVPGQLRELRDRAQVASAAISAAESRVERAEGAWLNAYADDLEAVQAKATSALERHDATTAKLLAALEAHDGSYVARAALEQARSMDSKAFFPATDDWQRPKSEPLQQAVAAAQKAVWVVRQLAAGVDLSSGVVEVTYPPLVAQCDALVPTPAHRRMHELDCSEAHESLRDVYRWRDRIEELEA